MRIKTTYLLLLLSIIFSTAAEAQVDSWICKEQYKRATNRPEKYDFVEESTNYLAKELTLDDFQKAAVKEIIAKEKDEIMAINEDKEMNSDINGIRHYRYLTASTKMCFRCSAKNRLRNTPNWNRPSKKCNLQY